VQGYGPFGFWGMLERQDQPYAEAPKFSASLEFLAKQRRWWKEKAREPSRGAGGAGAAKSRTSPAGPARK
jgi:hypothetical protein